MKIKLNVNNIDRQHFTRSRDEMRQLAKPLTQFGVEVFARVRIWPDQSFSLLTTHPEFSVLFVKEKFYEFAFAGRPDQYESGLILLDDTGICSPEVDRIRNAFVDLSHVKLDLTIIEKQKECTDLYWFGTPAENVNTANFYLNKTHILQNFVQFFKCEGGWLLKESSRQQFIYPTACADNTLLISPDVHKIISSQSAGFLKKSRSFTEKEWRCAQLVRQGKSPKEISQMLNRSTRTVEKHLINLRKKTNSKSLLELVAKLNHIDNHLFFSQK